MASRISVSQCGGGNISSSTPALLCGNENNTQCYVALAEGRDGSEYADHFEGLFGQQAYDRISAVGKDQILAIVQSLPVYANLGILQSKVPQFVEQFLAYGIEDADAGEEKKEDV